MTHLQFTALLCMYGVVIALSFAAEKFDLLPSHVSRAKPNRLEILKRKPRVYFWLLGLTVAIGGCCEIAGFVGMFFFWHYAPLLFACGVACRALLFQSFCWSVQSGLEHMFNELEFLVIGVILALVFLGPAGQFFI